MTATLQVTLREGYEPGAVGRIVELHGRYYARAWGAGAPFEILMARDVSDFLERYDPAFDLLVTAHLGEAMIGSLAVVGPDAAPRLRADPLRHRGCGRAPARGGQGHALPGAVVVPGARPFRGVPVDRGPSARIPEHVRKAGFRVVERCPDARYTVPRDNLRMELSLASCPRHSDI
jgi:hypothetical protein